MLTVKQTTVLLATMQLAITRDKYRGRPHIKHRLHGPLHDSILEVRETCLQEDGAAQCGYNRGVNRHHIMAKHALRNVCANQRHKTRGRQGGVQCVMARAALLEVNLVRRESGLAMKSLAHIVFPLAKADMSILRSCDTPGPDLVTVICQI